MDVVFAHVCGFYSPPGTPQITVTMGDSSMGERTPTSSPLLEHQPSEGSVALGAVRRGWPQCEQDPTATSDWLDQSDGEPVVSELLLAVGGDSEHSSELPGRKTGDGRRRWEKENVPTLTSILTRTVTVAPGSLTFIFLSEDGSLLHQQQRESSSHTRCLILSRGLMAEGSAPILLRTSSTAALGAESSGLV